ncbi:MAG: Hsp70 family protein [Deltaproteobacteria bacterium]|nr:Hsp70 family protein [Deltaproteobacteria bacterium]
MNVARPLRMEFGARVRIRVAGKKELEDRYAANLSAGGIFIRDDRPPAVGSKVLIEFVLPDGSALCRIEGKVVRAKPADVAGEKTAGMGVEFMQLDEFARQLAAYRTPPKEASETKVIEELTDAAQADEVVGIDLGTTNSCIALVHNGSPQIIASMSGFDTLPSVVFVGDKGKDKKVLTGHKAVERMILEPARAIYGAKRFIGRPFVSREVRTFGHFFHYELAEGQNGFTAVKIDGEVYPLEWVGACILAHLKQIAKKTLGRDIKKAVITVPAYFGETQRAAVRHAGKLAGLDVQRLISEPTAAAVAFGFGRALDKTILVYDLGGGTFDASILKIHGDRMEVLATDGDAFLGGSDFDDRVTELLFANIERSNGVDYRKDPVTVQRVRFAAELAKKQLSEAKIAMIDVPYIGQGTDGPINLNTTLEVELFESLTEDLVTRTLQIVENTLKMAGLKSSQIDEVVLVGGQSRSPIIGRRLAERFGKKPSRGVHPDHAVALGAAIVGAAAFGQAASKVSLDLTDILPAAIRVAQGGEAKAVLERGKPLPAEATFDIETSAGKTKEFVASLYRGDASKPEENELLGQVKLPSTIALALTKTKATLTLKVSEDGLMSVTLKHPLTDEVQTLSVALKEGTPAPIDMVSDADLIVEG